MAWTFKAWIFQPDTKHTWVHFLWPWLAMVVRHSNHRAFGAMRNLTLKSHLIYNYINSHNLVIKRIHDETWQDGKLIAQVWTAKEAEDNTVVTGLLHLDIKQRKTALLISSTLQLGNLKPVIDKWENHMASTLWFIKHMNIHTISFGQVPCVGCYGRLCKRSTNSYLPSRKNTASLWKPFPSLLLKVKFRNSY